MPDKFETYQMAKSESEIRQNMLLTSTNPDDWELAEKLENCTKKEPCESGACPKCLRKFRRWWYYETDKICDKYKKAYALTIVLYDELLENNQLNKYEPGTLKKRLRKQLVRSGFTKPVLGALDMDFDTELECWMPHFHLLVLSSEREIKTLRKRFYRPTEPIKGHSAMVLRPTHHSLIKDRDKQLTYLFKSYWVKKEIYIDETGKRRTRAFRLDKHELQTSLRYMDRVGIKGRLFLYKLRIRKGYLQITVDEQ